MNNPAVATLPVALNKPDVILVPVVVTPVPDTTNTLAFRFNLPVFNSQIEQIGTALPNNAIFEKPTLFVRGGNSNYILDSDLDQIKDYFPKAVFNTIAKVGHWLHAEKPQEFFELTRNFLKK